jgi:hypothetical protein
MPLTDTAAAVISVAQMITMKRSLPVLMPRLLASSSLIVNKLILQRRRNKGIILIVTRTVTNRASLPLIEVSEPMSQYVMAGSCSLTSAISFIKEVPAEKIELTIIPASTMDRVVLSLLALLMV